MERVIDCPVCFDIDNCFEDTQESFSSYLCFSCGFMSDSRYEAGNLQLIENLKKSPQLVQDSKFEDTHRNIVWFPSVINMGEKGIIYPDGQLSDWHCALSKSLFGHHLPKFLYRLLSAHHLLFELRTRTYLLIL